MLSVLALACGSAQAQTVDVDAAADVARQFFASQALSGPNRAPAKVDPVLSYTATTEDIPDFYVFNRADDAPGFVIVSAADAQTPILGYSENGTFDYATAPDNFRWWLQQYQQNGVAKAPARAAGRHDVDPLVTTQWGQDEPYNLALPRLTSTSKRFVTGCTATAMAQIMKFHNYPTRGKGSESYQTRTWNTSTGQVTPTFQADFESTSYNWSSMHDTYSSSDQSASAMAVATLMYHAGVAERADYGQKETSADDRQSAIALINHFRYSPAMLRAERAYLTDDEWDNTIYDELAAGRPIMYSGTTTANEGHTFVCDGYQASTNLFHMNWGWQGTSDGFFALVGDKALKPNEQGTGGAPSGLGFTQSQTINYNILATESGEYAPLLYVNEHFIVGTDKLVNNTFTTKTIDRSHGADIPIYYREAPFNYGFGPIAFQYGIILRHTATGRQFPQMGFANIMELNPSEYSEYYYTVSETDDTPLQYAHFNTTTAPYNGTYQILPAYTLDNGTTWHPMLTLVADVIPTITIIGGENAEAVPLTFSISASEVEVGKTITITPHNDYTGTVTYASSDNTVATVTPEGIVTALKEGHVTITATSAATAAFLATTKTFEIDVVGHIMHNVDVSISKNFLTVGETATITLTDGYDGEVTYTVAPAGVVTVSPTGTVTALADGEAVITVTVAGNADYKPTTKQFAVSVSSAPPAPVVPGFCFDNFPYAGENNIVTSSNMTLHMPLYNNSTSAIPPSSTFYVRMHCDGGSVRWTCGFGSSAYPAGYKYDYTIDPSEKYGGYFTPGKVYTYEFFLDEGCTKPMNVPSLTYYYCRNNPSVATLTTLIDNAKKGNGATVKIIKALANKLVGK